MTSPKKSTKFNILRNLTNYEEKITLALLSPPETDLSQNYYFLGSHELLEQREDVIYKDVFPHLKIYIPLEFKLNFERTKESNRDVFIQALKSGNVVIQFLEKDSIQFMKKIHRTIKNVYIGPKIGHKITTFSYKGIEIYSEFRIR